MIEHSAQILARVIQSILDKQYSWGMHTLQGGYKEKTLRTPQAKGDYIRNREPSNQQQIMNGRQGEEYEI